MAGYGTVFPAPEPGVNVSNSRTKMTRDRKTYKTKSMPYGRPAPPRAGTFVRTARAARVDSIHGEAIHSTVYVNGPVMLMECSRMTPGVPTSTPAIPN